MAISASSRPVNTAERILDVAERLVQVRGFNGFSYADVATELGVTRASLHYHYPGKAELGEALIARYSVRFAAALAKIDRVLPDAPTKLDAYVDLYADVVRGKRMCLCGILAAEYQTLAAPMRKAVVQFFDDNEVWLTAVLLKGQSAGTLVLREPPSGVAQMIIGGLEGAMLVARPYGDPARFAAAARGLITSLTG
jgi:TetR/AcrR family transcriptional repressor of nem operon